MIKDSDFFFSSRRRHTRSDRDWSSDVCSSDLYLTYSCRQLVVASAIDSATRISQVRRHPKSSDPGAKLKYIVQDPTPTECCPKRTLTPTLALSRTKRLKDSAGVMRGVSRWESRGKYPVFPKLYIRGNF